jgi:transposase
MRCHANARLSPIGRQLLVDRILKDGWTVQAAAESAGISERTARKWLARFRAEGSAGLRDRSSAPKTVANRSDRSFVQAICALRRLRFSGPQIAELLQRPLSTVSAVLKREGLGKLGRLGLEPAVRYERARPGELIHIDVKKLGRIHGGAGKRVTGIERNQRPKITDAAGVRRGQVGWDAVHIAIDDATRLAYAEVLADETASTAVAFLRRALAFFARHGIGVERVLTDNGSPYISAAHAVACRQLGSSTCAPAPTAHKPTARPSASSAPCSTAGPTARSTRQAENEPTPLTAGYGTTTIAAHTKPSADTRRSTG